MVLFFHKRRIVMDKKSEILSMVEEVYVNCILDYLYVIVRDAHRVAKSVQDSSLSLAFEDSEENIPE